MAGVFPGDFENFTKSKNSKNEKINRIKLKLKLLKNTERKQLQLEMKLKLKRWLKVAE